MGNDRLKEYTTKSSRYAYRSVNVLLAILISVASWYIMCIYFMSDYFRDQR